MKIAIVAPVDAHSAIGYSSSILTNELIRQGHDVTVVSSDANDPVHGTHSIHTSITRWNHTKKINSLLQGSDLVVYQIGDCYPFHVGCLELMPKFPGIVCLHDFSLVNLFASWSGSNRKSAEKTLNYFYGQKAIDEYFSVNWSTQAFEGPYLEFPLTEWIAAQARGLITHSSWGIARVLQSCSGPVHVLPLCYERQIDIKDKPRKAVGGDTKFNLLTIGNVNSNKRVSSVVEAIASKPGLREQVVYRLAGSINPVVADELSQKARSLSVDLEILGEVDDTTFKAAVSEADAISCLRWPALEAASASAIEALWNGKPVIVTNTGFYSEIPDACALKVDPDNEVVSIASALERLLTDADLRKALGSEGREWARKTFTAENYARGLIQMANGVLRTAPISRAIDHFSATLNSWGATDEIMCLDDMAEPLSIFSQN